MYDRDKQRVKIIVAAIFGYMFIALISGCYSETMYTENSSWLDAGLADVESKFEVGVITESGNNVAYQGEELLISVSPELITDSVLIQLANGADTITLIEEFHGPFPFSWQIPSNFPQGESYRILLNEEGYYKDSIPFGVSKEFAILSNTNSGLSDITVSSRTINITLTDNGSVIDGDTVTISLNNTTLAAKYVLTGFPGTTMSLSLLDGTNTLNITAVNEGSVSPNTAEITFTNVVSGEAVQQWRLNAGETGTVIIGAE